MSFSGVRGVAQVVWYSKIKPRARCIARILPVIEMPQPVDSGGSAEVAWQNDPPNLVGINF
jgi:hypothetical protein